MTSLAVVQQEMIRYGMSINLILGILILRSIGNCIIFTQPNYRHTANSIYFIFFSIVAIVYLIWSTVSYFHTLNYVDAQTQSLFYCKIRTFVTYVLGQYLRFSIVFVCVDRFLATQTNAIIRSMNSIALAKKLLLIVHCWSNHFRTYTYIHGHTK